MMPDSVVEDEEEDFVTFQYSYPFRVEEFKDCGFDQRLYSTEFTTVHKNIGFKWRIWVNPNGWCSIDGEELRDHIGVSLQYLGNKDLCPVVPARHKTFVDVKGNRQESSQGDYLFNHGFHVLDDGQSVALGTFNFLPISVDELRDRGLISPGEIFKVGLEIEIPERMFDWNRIFDTKISRMESEVLMSEAFQSISVSKGPERSPPSAYLGKFLDFKIETSDGVDIWCHSFILGGRKGYFLKMLQSGMKEEQERKTTEVYESGTMLELLHFIYTGTVSEKFNDQDPLIILDGANRYGLSSLKSISEGELIKRLNVENSPEHLLLAERYDLQVLREMALNMISENQGRVRKTKKGKELSEELWQEIMDVTELRMRVMKVLYPHLQ